MIFESIHAVVDRFESITLQVTVVFVWISREKLENFNQGIETLLLYMPRILYFPNFYKNSNPSKREHCGIQLLNIKSAV
jgi:hypothetical protein